MGRNRATGELGRCRDLDVDIPPCVGKLFEGVLDRQKSTAVSQPSGKVAAVERCDLHGVSREPFECAIMDEHDPTVARHADIGFQNIGSSLTRRRERRERILDDTVLGVPGGNEATVSDDSGARQAANERVLGRLLVHAFSIPSMASLHERGIRRKTLPKADRHLYGGDMFNRSFSPGVSAVLGACVAAILVGCSTVSGWVTIPRDPQGTFERVEGGVLRAGASIEEGLVNQNGDAVAGPLPNLVDAFAGDHDVSVTWEVGSEETLVKGLQLGRLDIVIGGFTVDTPWADRAAVTRAYPNIPGSQGREIVMLVPAGENRMLIEVESFLDRTVGSGG